MSDKAEELAEALCRGWDIKLVTVHMGGMSKTLEVAPWVAVAIRDGMSFARTSALEEAAKVADAAEQFAVANHIRALKDKPHE